ncbi:hypothetical protein RYX36_007121 [Vicia faba]
MTGKRNRIRTSPPTTISVPVPTSQQPPTTSTDPRHTPTHLIYRRRPQIAANFLHPSAKQRQHRSQRDHDAHTTNNTSIQIRDSLRS